MYIFFGVNNEICIISIEQLPNEGLESLWIYFEVCEIKDITCESESNVDIDITVLKIAQRD